MIPTLDASALARGDRDSMQTLADAVRDVGFLLLAGTPVTPAQVTQVIDAYRGFFAQSNTAKAQVDMARTGGNRGWGAPRSEQVDPGSNPDFKEVFDSGFELPPGDPMAARGLAVYAPNLWPDVPEFQAIIEAYAAAAMSVATEMLRAIAVAIGAPASHFDQAFERPMALLRGNYYPARPTSAGVSDFGIAPHTDYGCLTLLATDGQPGLDVQLRDGSWMPVIAPPGTFVINFGEMLEIWTRGGVRATPHRVIGGAGERLSVPLFFNPSYDTDIAPPGSPTPILAGPYLENRYRGTYVHLKTQA